MAAERDRAALAVEVADAATRRLVLKFDCSNQVDPDDQSLELWRIQHGQPRDSERSRILREALRRSRTTISRPCPPRADPAQRPRLPREGPRLARRRTQPAAEDASTICRPVRDRYPAGG